ncbi:MAG: hypothetical protein C0601_09705 [Candidatus Muiribacterium halophilum]|uniref:Uncharacterized protein n=1 Tax=Muiribacterium halophilum TaxID=2053465 RepID=A0A2N5ZDJ2_MUIH1|nr:MAG: hypothetical protein C0601_09705 [Candidatus Muirbacterium halophilum]
MVQLENVKVESLVEANRNFKLLVNELLEQPDIFLSQQERWTMLLRLRDRLKDSNTTNEHVSKFNQFIVDNVDLFASLPSHKERPPFYWWNHLDKVKDGEMNVFLNKAFIEFNGVGYSVE